jgi:hypothetical protein
MTYNQGIQTNQYAQLRTADFIMLFKCLMNSISKQGKNKILIWREQYMVGPLSSGNLKLLLGNHT